MAVRSHVGLLGCSFANSFDAGSAITVSQILSLMSSGSSLCFGPDLGSLNSPPNALSYTNGLMLAHRTNSSWLEVRDLDSLAMMLHVCADASWTTSKLLKRSANRHLCSSVNGPFCSACSSTIFPGTMSSGGIISSRALLISSLTGLNVRQVGSFILFQTTSIVASLICGVSFIIISLIYLRVSLTTLWASSIFAFVSIISIVSSNA